jgi:hypothetical protein
MTLILIVISVYINCKFQLKFTILHDTVLLTDIIYYNSDEDREA